MKTATKVLILEHDLSDIDLIQHELKKGNLNYTVQIVKTAKEYHSALRSFKPDIILADYSLPTFGGQAAFTMQQEIAPHTPFIFVSGTIGEEKAVELIKSGVTDYTLKDRLFTLMPKVTRALNAVKEKQQQIKADKEIQELNKVLQQSSHQHSTIFNTLPSHIALLDATGTIIAVNEAWKQFADNNKLSHTNYCINDNYIEVCELVTGADKPTARQMAEGISAILDGKLNDFALEYACHSPIKQRWFRVEVRPLADSKNSGAVVMHINITQRKLAEDALQLSEEKFRALYDATSDAVMLLNDTGFFDCNPATLRIFGCASIQEFYSKHPADLSPPLQPSGIDSLTLAHKHIDIAIQNGTHNFEWVHKRMDTGKLFHADVLLNRIVLNGKPVIETVVRNIDERKVAAENLARSEKHYRALIENISDAIVLINANSETIYHSPSAVRITGFTFHELKDKAVFDFIHPDDLQNCTDFFMKAFAQPGVPLQNRYRLLHKQGHYIWIEGTITNLLHDESVKAFVVNYRDITERVDADAKILASEQRYHSLFDNMMEGFAYCKMIYENGEPTDFIYLDVNTAFENLTGLKAVVGKKVTEVIPGIKQDSPDLFAIYNRVALTGKPERFEVYIKAIDMWLDISVYSNQSEHFTAVFDVITDRKKAEEQREFDRNNLDALINNTNDLLWSVDRDFNLITANLPFDEMSKINFGAIAGRGSNILSLAYTPEMKSHYKLQYERAFAGEAYTETEHFTEPFEFWSEISYYPIRNGDEIIGTACNSRDVTVAKKAEIKIKDLNENLEKKVFERTTELTEANTALEAFSYSVSHDLRSPVRSVLGFAKIIKKSQSTTLSQDTHEMLTHIEDNAKRMNIIIDGLLDFAKAGKEKLKLKEVDLTLLFRNAWDDLLFTLPGNAQFILPQLPVANVDTALMQQVITNLLSNAIKYSSKKTQQLIEVGYQATALNHTISVKDNGAGFDMKNYGKLFGAFQRLHGTSDFEGTGIGLMLVKLIVEKHGGKIWAESKVDEGATFYFSLPKSITL